MEGVRSRTAWQNPMTSTNRQNNAKRKRQNSASKVSFSIPASQRFAIATVLARKPVSAKNTTANCPLVSAKKTQPNFLPVNAKKPNLARQCKKNQRKKPVQQKPHEKKHKKLDTKKCALLQNLSDGLCNPRPQLQPCSLVVCN